MSWRLLLLPALILLELGAGTMAQAQPAGPPAESTYIKLLKKAPEARLGTIMDAIGKRGDAGDLAYLLNRATGADAAAPFPPAARPLALAALADAAATRNLRPNQDLDRLNQLITLGPDPDALTRSAAIRLAGVWRLTSAVAPLVAVASAARGVEPADRLQAIEALAAIGTKPAQVAIEQVAAAESAAVQRGAIAALVRLDISAAAHRAATVIAAATPDQDLAPLIAAFLDRQGGADQLLAAIHQRPPSADGARLALRAISAGGRSAEALVAALSKIAGFEADPPPPTPSEMATLVADVTARGDAARGEAIFRRPEINCTKCHAIAGAGGGVGPDLSAVGLSSPIDYVINSILVPDQAIKEEFQTRVIQTDDGQVLQGIVVEEDDRRVVLKDALGERRAIATSSIEASKRGGSLMPKGLVMTLTRGEFLDLVRFVSELGRPGQYAIRATPTMQRWRALHPVPTGPNGSDPLPAADLVAESRRASASAWVPIYGWTGGELPIAEILAVAGGPIGLIQGEVAVSAPGLVEFRFGPGPRPDLTAWVDDKPVPIGPAGSATVPLEVGTRRLTVRVDGKNDHGLARPIRVEVVRASGSPAEFAVVGGP